MSKTFNVAGWSVLKGVKKMRFAAAMDRVKVLMRNGHTDVELMTLPHAMTKEDATIWLNALTVAAPVAAVVAEAAVEPVAEDAVAEDAVAEAVVEPVAEAVVEPVAEAVVEPAAPITYATFEEALAAVPLRAHGRFIKKELREQMAREMVAV